MIHRVFWSAFALLVLILLFTGCLARRTVDPQRVLATDKFSSRQPSLVFPEAFSSMQRVKIEGTQQTMQMIGVLEVFSPTSYRAVAVSEMGARIFEFHHGPEGDTLVTFPPGIREQHLLHGPIVDISLLFLPGQGLLTWYCDRGDTLLQAQDLTIAEGRLELLLERETGRPKRMRQIVNGTILREVLYKDYRVLPTLNRAVPHTIILYNRQLQYRMNVQIIELQRIGIEPGTDSMHSEETGTEKP